VTDAGRRLAPVASLIAGLVIGLMGAFVQAHRSVLVLGDRYMVLPWGVVIVLAVLVVAIRGVTLGSKSRWSGWLLLAGWIAMTVFLASETAGGDIAISSGFRQWAYLLVGTVIGSAVATLPGRPLRPTSVRDLDAV